MATDTSKPALAPELDVDDALPDELEALLTRDAAEVAPLQAAQAGMGYFSQIGRAHV